MADRESESVGSETSLTSLRELPSIEPYGELPTPDGVDVVALDVPAGRLTAYRVIPEGEIRAVVLLVPGYTGSKEDFRTFLPLLRAHGIAALAFSRRGQADSVAPASLEEYSLDDEAADVVRVARVLGGGHLVHLLGHSLGGVIGRAAVIAAPEMFSSYTLLCSGPEGWRNRKLLERTLAATEGNAAIWRAVYPEAAALPNADLSADVRFTRDRMTRTSSLSIIAGAHILENEYDATPELAATGVRTLVAHGEWDAAWPLSWQRRMAQNLGARYAVIPRAYHSPHNENPPVTAELLTELWAG